MKIPSWLLPFVASGNSSSGWIEKVAGSYIPTPYSMPPGFKKCGGKKIEWTKEGEGGNGSHEKPYYGLLVGLLVAEEIKEDSYISSDECFRRFLVQNFKGYWVEIEVLGFSGELVTSLLLGPKTCEALTGSKSCNDVPVYPLPNIAPEIYWTLGPDGINMYERPITACKGFEKKHLNPYTDGSVQKTARDAIILLEKIENSASFCGNIYQIEGIYFQVVGLMKLKSLDRRLAVDQSSSNEICLEGCEEKLLYGEFVEGVIGDKAVKATESPFVFENESTFLQDSPGSSRFIIDYILVFLCLIF
eukprot:GHVP01002049.1.p1 GENE.GHVP01002049.1~~GHVP01002049.1.p1  ORF type:complete len:303 (+),score=48.01 GHVP01002049.1:992-1900(+)